MRRRRHTLLNPMPGSPTRERQPLEFRQRRPFRQLTHGVAGERERVRLVNLKCLNKSDGTIVWEIGAIFFPVQQYGADYIHCFQIVPPKNLDTYILELPTDGTLAVFENRNTKTLGANRASDAVEVLRLNSDDGTEANRSAVPWLFSMFAVSASTPSFTPGERFFGFGSTVVNIQCDGLSGGDMIIAGHVPIQIELTDYASNNTTKTYVFHPHTHTAGTVTMKTLVSDQTITFGYNVSAASLKTALESVGDVSSATVTGGPWPLAALNVSVTWSSSSGDFKSAGIEATTLAGFSNRPTRAALFTVDPTNGTISDTFGCIFGDYSAAVKMHPSVSGFIPTVPDAVSDASRPIAGASNSFAVSESNSNNPNWFEGWNATTKTEIWCVYNNHTVSSGERKPYIHQRRSHAGYVYITGTKKTLAGSDWVGCKVDIAGGTRTEVNHTQSALNNMDCWMTDADNDSATNAYSQFTTRFQQTSPAVTYVTVDEQGELDISGNIFRVGAARLIGLDASDFFVWHGQGSQGFRYKNPAATPSLITSTNARGYLWRFYLDPGTHYDTGTEFRFKFTGNSGNPTKYSDWIDWLGDATAIEAAINSVFAANTGGVVDNVQVWPFGAPTAFDNTHGHLEQYLEILFAGAANATGISELYIPATYVQQNKITIEIRTPTAEFSPPGIASFNRSTCSLNWSRKFGEQGGNDIAYPLDAWVRGDYVYAYGALVDNEIP